jgi:hypothetical protein
MLAHSPRAFPLGAVPSVGAYQGKRKRRPKARARRPRPRTCLCKECGREYLPRCWNQRYCQEPECQRQVHRWQARCWNQRYCQEPECQRQVHRWQAARRQAKHRQNAFAKARHSQAEKLRRQRAKLASQVDQNPEVTPARGHADGSAEIFFRLPYAIGQATTNRL